MLILSFAFTFALPSSLEAQGLPPFGGLSTIVFPCTCSMNFLITIGPPKGGQFIYQPGVSRINRYGMVLRPGAWQLGLYTPGGVCMIYLGKGCSSYGKPKGTIFMVGTSM